MAHSAGAPYALSFASKYPERVIGDICLLAPWVGGGVSGKSFSMLIRLSKGSHMYIRWLPLAQICSQRVVEDGTSRRMEDSGLDDWQTPEDHFRRNWI